MVKRIPSKKKVVAPPSRVYRIIAVSFLAAAFLLLAAVAYVAFSKATIVITPKREVLTTSLTVMARAEPEAEEIKGMVHLQATEDSRLVRLEGGGSAEPAAARGRVTIKNTTTRDQPLVRTTRLTTPLGQLFRLDRTVLVPANGSTEVEIYADELGPDFEIGPTRFVIPGLWEGLRDKIYAESSDPTCCGTRSVRKILADDIDQAQANLKNELLAAIQDEMRMQAISSKLDGEVFLSELTGQRVDAEAGEDRDSFTVSASLKVTGIFYDQIALLKLVRASLRNLAGEERELVELDPERMKVVVESVDSNAGTARLSVEAPGLLIIHPTSDLFDLARLVGLSREAVVSYFERFRSIESVEIRFAPPWQTRLPKLQERIRIEVVD